MKLRNKKPKYRIPKAAFIYTHKGKSSLWSCKKQQQKQLQKKLIIITEGQYVKRLTNLGSEN